MRSEEKRLKKSVCGLLFIVWSLNRGKWKVVYGLLLKTMQPNLRKSAVSLRDLRKKKEPRIKTVFVVYSLGVLKVERQE